MSRPRGSKRQGSLGDGWITVRRICVAFGVAVASLAGAGLAVAERPDTAGIHVIHMQTAFNPNLPGAGEGVRTFTQTLKHMSAGGLAIKIIEPGRVAPTPDMLDAVVSGDLEGAFTWAGYAMAKAPVFSLFATVPFGPGPEDMTSWLLEGDGGRIH